MNYDAAFLRKLQWRARRGLLELDLLLSPFVAKQFMTLELSQKEDFIQLLALDDPTLLAYLMGHESPKCPKWQILCQRIRDYAMVKT